VVLAGLGNVVINVTGARASHFKLLAVYVALVVVVCLASTLRANAGHRRLYVFGAALTVGSAEQDLVREPFARVANGDSSVKITRWLRAAGVRASRR